MKKPGGKIAGLFLCALYDQDKIKPADSSAGFGFNLSLQFRLPPLLARRSSIRTTAERTAETGKPEKAM